MALERLVERIEPIIRASLDEGLTEEEIREVISKLVNSKKQI